MNKRRPFVWTALAIGAATSPSILAEAPESTRALETIVVTATKSEVDIFEVPAAISVISRKKIERQGAQTAVEALQGEPAVRISTYTEGNFPVVQIRSSGDAGQFQNTDVLVLIDGIPQVRAIERIEVVRGPTSALYGRNAVSGTINIISAASEAPLRWSSAHPEQHFTDVAGTAGDP